MTTPENAVPTLAEMKVHDGQMSIDEALRQQASAEGFETAGPSTVKPEDIGSIALLQNIAH